METSNQYQGSNPQPGSHTGPQPAPQPGSQSGPQTGSTFGPQYGSPYGPQGGQQSYAGYQGSYSGTAGGPGRTAGFFNSLRASQYRRPFQRVVGGVSGALARAWNLDIALVRGLLILLFIFMPFALTLYAVAWLLLPEEHTGKIVLEELFQGRPTGSFFAALILILLSTGRDGIISISVLPSVFGTTLLSPLLENEQDQLALPVAFFIGLLYLSWLVWMGYEITARRYRNVAWVFFGTLGVVFVACTMLGLIGLASHGLPLLVSLVLGCFFFLGLPLTFIALAVVFFIGRSRGTSPSPYGTYQPQGPAAFTAPTYATTEEPAPSAANPDFAPGFTAAPDSATAVETDTTKVFTADSTGQTTVNEVPAGERAAASAVPNTAPQQATVPPWGAGPATPSASPFTGATPTAPYPYPPVAVARPKRTPGPTKVHGYALGGGVLLVLAACGILNNVAYEQMHFYTALVGAGAIGIIFAAVLLALALRGRSGGWINGLAIAYTVLLLVPTLLLSTVFPSMPDSRLLGVDRIVSNNYFTDTADHSVLAGSITLDLRQNNGYPVTGQNDGVSDDKKPHYQKLSVGFGNISLLMNRSQPVRITIQPARYQYELKLTSSGKWYGSLFDDSKNFGIFSGGHSRLLSREYYDVNGEFVQQWNSRVNVSTSRSHATYVDKTFDGQVVISNVPRGKDAREIMLEVQAGSIDISEYTDKNYWEGFILPDGHFVMNQWHHPRTGWHDADQSLMPGTEGRALRASQPWQGRPAKDWRDDDQLYSLSELKRGALGPWKDENGDGFNDNTDFAALQRAQKDKDSDNDTDSYNDPSAFDDDPTI